MDVCARDLAAPPKSRMNMIVVLDSRQIAADPRRHRQCVPRWFVATSTRVLVVLSSIHALMSPDSDRFRNSLISRARKIEVPNLLTYPPTPQLAFQ